MAEADDTAYPVRYETEVLLKDGSRILLRPIKRDDVERWLDFISRLSDRTKYLRFHSVPKLGREDAVRFCSVDYDNAFAFVAEVLRDRRRDIVAIGRYYRIPYKSSAEVSFVIEDAYQRKGIGTKFMEWLANVARDNGITTFEASVLAENMVMMNVFKDYGFHVTSELEENEYRVTFPIARTKLVTQKEEARERTATVTSLRSLLYPRSVAVIGASREAGTIGQLLFRCIMQNRFSGVVYPINPNAEAIMSVKAYPSVFDVPGDIDLALIAVPASLVVKVTDECGRKGVHGIVVISDGFKERGGEGAQREQELRDIALGHGMRIVGPNCMGVINTDPGINLNATFSRIFPPQGNVAFLSQSGALGLSILEYANNLNIGISTFISVGNRADISSNDMLQYWEQDEATAVILLYLESFGNPRKFARIARRVSGTKPIVAVKGGSSIVGSRAALSHTGAMATPQIASDALFHQAGIIRVNALEELFNVATLLSNQPVPRGRRVAIVTNGGGPGIIAADACEHYGLALPELSPDVIKTLRSVVKRDIMLRNPLDLTAAATEEDFKGVLKILANDNSFDAIFTIFMPPTIVDPKETEDAIRQVAPFFQRKKKTLLACFMGQRGFKTKLGTSGKFVPCYPFPEEAVSALAKAAEYSDWLKRPKGSIPKIRGLKREKAQNLIDSALTSSPVRPLWLSAQGIADLLDCYGIRITETVVAKTPAEAAATASRLGFPTAVKLASSTIVHKTDVGGVSLGLTSEKEVENAFIDMKARLIEMGRQAEMEGVTVQRMVQGGIEVIVGVTQDPSFGPIIMFGLGGVYAELMKDVAVRLHPLTNVDAQELVGSIKMAKLFEGFRGAPPSDTQSLEDLLLRLSALIEDIPQIAELDFNPVKVMERGKGYWVVDARIMVK
ncbi:MAG: GNAT family N-acetyltransferase [Deltaproteobacteria bacterium]|nr:GNAT family N-acetyltransferase [Deltaproteobacteria bacterium]